MARPFHDLSGRTFGDLTVIGPARVAGRFGWLCRCACGSERAYVTALLTNAEPVRTCGCKREKGRLKTSGTSSRYKGVGLRRRRSGSAFWAAQITVGNRRLFLGRFDHEISAAQAYDAAARTYFGPAARTNSDMELYPWQS